MSPRWSGWEGVAAVSHRGERHQARSPELLRPRFSFIVIKRAVIVFLSMETLFPSLVYI